MIDEDLGHHPHGTTLLYGTPYKVGDKLTWSCQQVCGNPLSVDRAGTIVTLGPEILPGSGVPAFGRAGEFQCGTCHRRTVTLFPPDEDGVKSQAKWRERLEAS